MSSTPKSPKYVGKKKWSAPCLHRPPLPRLVADWSSDLDNGGERALLSAIPWHWSSCHLSAPVTIIIITSTSIIIIILLFVALFQHHHHHRSFDGQVASLPTCLLLSPEPAQPTNRTKIKNPTPVSYPSQSPLGHIFRHMCKHFMEDQPKICTLALGR